MLSNFHFALNEGGYLFLGKSEALVRRTGLFDPVDLKRHVFVKRSGRQSRPSLAPTAAATALRGPRPYDLGDLSFENAPVAQIVVDRSGMLVLANRHVRTLFGLGLNQVGRPFKDLELSYRPVELRSRIDQVFHERPPSAVNDVQLSLPGGGTEYLDVFLLPPVSDSHVNAVALTFLEVGRYKVLREELERSQRELEAAYEELQSINEELETTNNELRQRSIELDDVNAFLESILGSLGWGVIVLSRQLTVRVWNKASEELWGLRSDEVQGQQFLALDIGLPVDQLSQPIRAPRVVRTATPPSCDCRPSTAGAGDRRLRARLAAERRRRES